MSLRVPRVKVDLGEVIGVAIAKLLLVDCCPQSRVFYACDITVQQSATTTVRAQWPFPFRESFHEYMPAGTWFLTGPSMQCNIDAKTLRCVFYCSLWASQINVRSVI